MYQEYRDRFEFLLVYIREAHPNDGRMPDDRETDVDEPRTLDERRDVAGTCVANLRLTMPTLLDNMENTTDLAYSAWPDRLFVVGTDGRVAWKSGLGPQGFSLEGLRGAMERQLGGDDE